MLSFKLKITVRNLLNFKKQYVVICYRSLKQISTTEVKTTLFITLGLSQ